MRIDPMMLLVGAGGVAAGAGQGLRQQDENELIRRKQLADQAMRQLEFKTTLAEKGYVTPGQAEAGLETAINDPSRALAGPSFTPSKVTPDSMAAPDVAPDRLTAAMLQLATSPGSTTARRPTASALAPKPVDETAFRTAVTPHERFTDPSTGEGADYVLDQSRTPEAREMRGIQARAKAEVDATAAQDAERRRLAQEAESAEIEKTTDAIMASGIRMPDGTPLDRTKARAIAWAHKYAPELVRNDAKSAAEIPGTPEWKAAEKYKSDLQKPQFDQFTDPKDNTPHYVTKDEAAAKGYVKTPSGAGGGAGLSPDDRARMLGQAAIDNREMKRVEKRVLDGDLQWGTAAGLAEAAAEAHGGMINDWVGVLGNAAAAALDPDIQSYINAKGSYGRIMGNLQAKRYTDHQADIEKRLSGMSGNDLVNTIRYKQQLRDASLADPGKAPGAPKSATTSSAVAGSGTKAQLTQAQYDAGIARGHSDTEIAQHYDLTGVKRRP